MNKIKIVFFMAGLACLAAACATNQPPAAASQPAPAKATSSDEVSPTAVQPSAAAQSETASTAVPASGNRAAGSNHATSFSGLRPRFHPD